MKTFSCFHANLLVLSGLMVLNGLLTACRNDVACQAPPPDLRLKLSDPAAIVDQRKISLYSFQQGRKTDVPYLRYSRMTGSDTADLFVSAYAMIQDAAQADSAQFLLEYDGKTVGRLRLETFRNTDRCNGWMQLARLTYNGKLVTAVDYAYPIPLRP